MKEVLNDSQEKLSAQNRKNLESAHRNGLRLLKLVNSLLDFSRIEAGQMEPIFKPVDIVSLTKNISNLFQTAFEKADIDYHIDCEAINEKVYVDPEMWEKIVLNLISNAFKFTFNGSIKINLGLQGSNVILTVLDTGTGIEADQLPNLFKRFYRVPNAQGRSFEGSGIGLALVYELVKLHGGELTVQSEAGKGSVFVVSIPRGKAHLLPKQISETTPVSNFSEAQGHIGEVIQWLNNTAEVSNEENPIKDSSFFNVTEDLFLDEEFILVADDNADMRNYLRSILSKHWRVITVADGQQALDYIKWRPPSLLVSDVMMPKLDGFELITRLRENESLPYIPVILLSARAGENDYVDGLTEGADDYVAKPFNPQELVARIKTHIELTHLREKAIKQAQHDPLTDLPNRALTYEIVAKFMYGADRQENRLALLYFDLDKFKPINDTYGHAAGDAVLNQVAHRLKQGMRRQDIAGRIGGDEFLVALPKIESEQNAIMVASKLSELLSEPYYFKNIELNTKPSIGISIFPDDGENIDQLINRADKAMYHAKHHSTRNIQRYSRVMDRRSKSDQRIENALIKAIDSKQLSLHYQPMLNLENHTLTGVEAFLRCPEIGCGPDQFIPIAEQSSLIETLGEWVANEACRQLHNWDDEGMENILVSLNTSPRNFIHSSYSDSLKKAVNTHNIKSDRIQLELQESVLSSTRIYTIDLLKDLKEKGFHLALEHFSMDSLSLKDVFQLPIDTLKMHRDLCFKLRQEPENLKMIDTIAGMGESLNLQVVAEGVENAYVLKKLQATVHPIQLQGYHLCPPCRLKTLKPGTRIGSVHNISRPFAVIV